MATKERGNGLITTVPGAKIGLNLHVNTESFDPITKNDTRTNGGDKTKMTKNDPSNRVHRKEQQINIMGMVNGGGTVVNGIKNEPSTINKSFISDLLSS